MIAFDTHALIWWVSDPRRIPLKARRMAQAAVTRSEPIVVSAISVWEIAMLVEHGRLALTLDLEIWLTEVEALPFLSFVPVDNRIACRAVRLDGFPHRDPADRIIVATALAVGATLVTADSKLRGYPALKTAWD